MSGAPGATVLATEPPKPPASKPVPGWKHLKKLLPYIARSKGQVAVGMLTNSAMGIVGTLVGSGLELLIEPYFPRRVIATYGDIGQMLVAMTVIAVLASVLAVRRAMRVDPRSVLSTG